MRALAFAVWTLAAVSLAACAAQPNAHRGPTRLATSPEAGDAQDAAPDERADGGRQANLTRPGGRPSLDSLPGMRGAELTGLMGAPQFRHRDGKAEIWQYRGTACILDVFLYADGDDLRVRYVEARGRGDAKDAASVRQARTCAGDLLDARANGAS